MKLLLFFTHDFWLKPHSQGLLPSQSGPVPDEPREVGSAGAVVAFIHAEPGDADDPAKVVTKAIKNVKWVAGKFGSKRAVLHFFAHLARETAPPELARSLVAAMAERLRGAGYEVEITPFGWFNEMKLHIAGESMAKVFVDIRASDGQAGG